MSCRRAFELDLADFLLDPRAAEWAEFRDHYPRCPDCAPEVAVWTELETQLGAAHPSPELLLRWSDEPAALPPAERARVTRHLDGCRSCMEELRTLGRFDAVVRSAQTPPPATAARAVLAADDATRRQPLRAVGRVLWHPAVPWALLLLLAYPTLMARHQELSLQAPVTLERSVEPPGAGSGGAAPSPPPPAAAPAPKPAQPAAPPAVLGHPAGVTGEPKASRRSGGEEQDRAAAPETESEQEPRERSFGKIGAARREAPAADADLRGAAPPPPPAAGMLYRRGFSADAPAPASQSPARLSPSAADGTRRLTIALPSDLPRDAAVEVRVATAGGTRELRQAASVPAGARELAVALPAAWLVSGDYTVAVYGADGHAVVQTALHVR